MADELSPAKLAENFLAMERNRQLEREMADKLSERLSRESPQTEAVQLSIGYLSLIAGQVWLFPSLALARAHRLAAQHGWSAAFSRIAHNPRCCGALRGFLPAKKRSIRELAKQPAKALRYHDVRLRELNLMHQSWRVRTAETLRSESKLREVLQPTIERELDRQQEQQRQRQLERERLYEREASTGRTRGRERSRERDEGYER